MRLLIRELRRPCTVRGKVEGGQVVTYFDGGESTELAEIIDRGEIDPSRFQPGMVVAVIKDPTGKYRPAQLSARKLSKKVRTELFSLMQTEGPAAQEAVDTILEVMGSPQYAENPDIRVENFAIQRKDAEGNPEGEASIAITFKDHRAGRLDLQQSTA